MNPEMICFALINREAMALENLVKETIISGISSDTSPGRAVMAPENLGVTKGMSDVSLVVDFMIYRTEMGNRYA